MVPSTICGTASACNTEIADMSPCVQPNKMVSLGHFLALHLREPCSQIHLKQASNEIVWCPESTLGVLWKKNGTRENMKIAY